MDLSLNEKINHRVGHTAKAYKQFVLLWGGFKTRVYQNHFVGYPDIHPPEIVWMFNTITQIWEEWLTRGDVPPAMTRFASVVHEDSFYVFGGYFCTGPDEDVCNRLYRLDLNTRMWNQVLPTGRPPVAVSDVIAWTHNDLLYFFGGSCPPPISPNPDFNYEDHIGAMFPHGWVNQLVLYSPADNAWTRIHVSGTPPSPRCSVAGDVSGDKAFIFGGQRHPIDDSWYKDIHWLDMKNQKWERISSEDNNALQDTQIRISTSFTFITPNKAVIYGGLNDAKEILNGGWVLNTDDMSFSPLPRHRKWPPVGRYGHSACFTGKSLFFVGGYQDRNKSHTTSEMMLQYTPRSLLSLCLRAVRVSVPIHEWQDPEAVPASLRETLNVATLQEVAIQPRRFSF